MTTKIVTETLLTAVFQSLKDDVQEKSETRVKSDDLHEAILKAKNVSEILSMSNRNGITRDHALKVIK